MDTSIEFAKVLNKLSNGQPVNYREMAIAIANHEETLLQFLADNDYKQVYRLLHEIPQVSLSIGKNATFEPSKSRVEAELKLLYIKKEGEILNTLIRNFRLNPVTQNYTTNQKLLSSLRDIGVIGSDSLGNYFNISPSFSNTVPVQNLASATSVQGAI
jgi:ribosomal protein S8